MTHTPQRLGHRSPDRTPLTSWRVPLACLVSWSMIWHAEEQSPGSLSRSLSFWRGIHGIFVGAGGLPTPRAYALGSLGCCGAGAGSAADPKWQEITHPCRSNSSVTFLLWPGVAASLGWGVSGEPLVLDSAMAPMPCIVTYKIVFLSL